MLRELETCRSFHSCWSALSRAQARSWYRALANDLVVVDHGGAIIFLFVVKFRHFVGTSGLLAFKKLKVSARLRRLLTVWVVKEEIFERGFGVGRGRKILCPRSRSRKPDVTD